MPFLCRNRRLAGSLAKSRSPGIFPLVAKLPRGVVPSGDPRVPGYANATGEARVMRLKGYGNAICVDTAKLFIECAMETIEKEG